VDAPVGVRDETMQELSPVDGERSYESALEALLTRCAPGECMGHVALQHSAEDVLAEEVIVDDAPERGAKEVLNGKPVSPRDHNPA
jgi:hypothetical protein